ncbi:MAG TPA: hypothetical protein VEW28_05695 [Candidatus Kapabacteria bacterium]|nr:hypothetical protein [Candidatus Kapabacteria bacterium]
MTLQHIRNTILDPSGRGNALRWGFRVVFAAYMFVFVSDTLNLDVLFASLHGKIQFVDDAAISDSLFDTGTTVHSSVFDAAVKTNDNIRFSSRAANIDKGDLTRLNTVYEDEDSPGIEDAHTSSSISSDILAPLPKSDIALLTTPLCIDRTITFGQILI